MGAIFGCEVFLLPFLHFPELRKLHVQIASRRPTSSIGRTSHWTTRSVRGHAYLHPALRWAWWNGWGFIVDFLGGLVRGWYRSGVGWRTLASGGGGVFGQDGDAQRVIQPKERWPTEFRSHSQLFWVSNSLTPTLLL